MSASRQEEIISVLYVIAALLAFNGGYVGWGWIFAVKAACDCACAIWLGWKEIKAEKAEQENDK